jgi:hypothetical protein
MSEETVCFSATVYVDNHKIGTVVNRGHGGSNEYQWTDPMMGHVLEDWAEKEVILTADPTNPEKVMFVTCEKLDWKIGEILDEWETRQWFKTKCRSKTLFKIKSDGDQFDPKSWRTVKAAFGPEIKAWLIDRFGDDLGEIANETRI